MFGMRRYVLVLGLGDGDSVQVEKTKLSDEVVCFTGDESGWARLHLPACHRGGGVVINLSTRLSF